VEIWDVRGDTLGGVEDNEIEESLCLTGIGGGSWEDTTSNCLYSVPPFKLPELVECFFAGNIFVSGEDLSGSCDCWSEFSPVEIFVIDLELATTPGEGLLGVVWIIDALGGSGGTLLGGFFCFCCICGYEKYERQDCYIGSCN